MKHLKSMNFKNKIFLIFTLTFSIIIVLSGVSVFGVAMPSMKESNVQYEHELVRQSSRRIDDYLSQINSLCIQASYSTFTRSILDKHYNNNITERFTYTNDRSDAFKFYQDFSRTSDGIVSIFIYNSNGYPYYFTSKEPVVNDFNMHSQKWYPPLASAKNYGFTMFSDIHHPPQIDNSRSYVVSLMRNIRSISDFSIQGQAEIQIDPNAFKKVLNDTELQSDGTARHMTLVDSSGKVIYSDQEQYAPGDNFNPEIFSYARNSSDPELQPKSDSILVSVQHSSYSGWYLIGETDREIIMKDIRKIVSLFVIFGIISVSLIMILGFFISREITKPIELLKRKVRELEHGDFDSQIILNSNDEFSRLADSFNEMSQKLKEYVQRIYTVEGQKREAEIAALQAQINPHFTLNTLNTIKYLATLQNSTNIVAMLEDFTILIKTALKSPNELITLEEELNRIKAFFRIQEISSFGKIKMELKYDENVLDCLTIGLILQPIVENAVFHGIKPKMESHQIQTGRIQILVDAIEDNVLIHIIDDGVGMDQNDADRLLSQNGSGIGVKNVNTRIKLRFGEQYGLSINSAVGKGCDVLIRLPQIRKGAS